MDVLEIFVGIYFIIWFSLFIGILFMKRGSSSSKKLHEFFVDRQIKKFQYPPFKNLLNLWLSNQYIVTSLTFIFLIIIPAVFLFFILGLLLISPILALFQGFTVGILIGKLKGKEMTWALLVGIFEFGYWALSGAFGLDVTIETLFYGKSFFVSLSSCVDILAAGYWIPLVIFICGNAFGEVAGPIYFNIKSPISLSTLSKGKTVSDSS